MSNQLEVETLRRRIWMLRGRGLTYKQIANAVQRSVTTVRAHLKKARQSAYEAIDADGQKEILGEMLLCYRELRQEAMRNMTQAEVGSPMRATWIDNASRRLNDEARFLLETGLIQKAADRVEFSVRDMRHMSDEEIRREIQQLKVELVECAPPDLLLPAPDEDADADVIDVEAHVVLDP